MASGIIKTAPENFDEAINVINRAIDLDPLYKTVFLSLINSHYRINNYNDAIEVYQRKFSNILTEDLPIYHWGLILSAYIKAGQNDAATGLYTQIIKDSPTFNPSNLRVGGAVLPKETFDALVYSIESFAQPG